MSNDSERLDRRAVVKRVGAVGAAAVGATGVAGATDPATADASVEDVRSAAAASRLPVDPFARGDLARRTVGELVAGAEGVAELETTDGRLVVTQRRVGGRVVRAFRDPATDEGHAVVERGDRRRLVGDGVTDLTSSSTCANECQREDCGFGEQHVELIYEEDSSGDCVAVDYDCGC
ncbi:MAG: hypothetical protein ABEI75_05080 [Halobaculum sp.]